MEKKPLTEIQQLVYNFIVSYLREYGFSPSYRDIRDEFGFSALNSATTHVNNLRDKGYITVASSRGAAKGRTIRLVDDIIGNYTIDTLFLNKSLKKLKERGYKIDANTAVEFLKELKVIIV